MTAQDFSNDSDSIWKAIDALIIATNQDGMLNPAAQTFVALAICQVAKKEGSRESELAFVTNLSIREHKEALEQLDRIHLIRMDHSPRLISTVTEAKIYIPSGWARGKPVERITGPRVASYVLNLNEDLTIANLEGRFKTSIDDLLALVKGRIEEAEETVWREYVKFARIVLNQIKLCAIRTRALYGDYMPREISDSITLLLSTFDEIEFRHETRQTAIALVEKAIHLLKQSLIRVQQSIEL
ncbi:MAG TPA: hypothetical protein VGS11_11055 [Candidatus Bathyarchaeia archaeon]|nr:hypothetical protein [Candidatus Bathyarchaeia archaeon]